MLLPNSSKAGGALLGSAIKIIPTEGFVNAKLKNIVWMKYSNDLLSLVLFLHILGNPLGICVRGTLKMKSACPKLCSQCE
jgi:hypothetical protein